MLNTAAALAMFWAALSGSGEPQPYEAVVALEAAAVVETPAADEGSVEASALSAEQAELMEGDPDWRASARLYHAGGGGATGNDSLGCRPIAMRTVAVDPRVIPRRTRLFIRETVGLRLADGTRHDGYWYASDTGGAIKGAKIDLYTGHGRGSMRQAQSLNMKTLTIADAGDFQGCPPAWENASN
ncbi:3D domain-containing protein [Brevundimonas faecalis]|uniref:3D (Asp-Asp-Asp) domain-containing protein n=1 Tax=Brevundimonas faecalis TaxID=947378 RepID=A0ABV2RFQ4_9CAUL